jgi:hypothetical protein
MNWREVLKPNLLKIITVVVVFLALYFFLSTTMKIQYLCEVAGEACIKEIEQVKQNLVLKDTLLVGVPLAIIAYFFIGFLQSRKK